MLPRPVYFLLALWPLVLPAQQPPPLIAKPEASASSAKTVPLTLRHVADKAMLNSLQIAITRIETDKTADTIDLAESGFDPAFTAATGWQRNLPPDASSYVVNRTRIDSWTNSLGLAKKFSTGGTLALNTSLNTSWLSPNQGWNSPDNQVAFRIEGRQPLLSGGGATVNLAPIVQARQNLLKSKLNLRKIVLDLLHDVEVAYWRLAASHALLSLRESSLASAEKLLSEARARHAVGDATRQDELQAEAEVASQRVTIVNARRAIADAEDQLRLLLSGMNRVEMDPLPVEELPGQAPPAPPAFARWISTVRAFDIDAQINAIAIEQADLDVRVADNANQPSLDLVAGAAALGQDRAVNDAYAGVFERNGYNLNAGLELRIPVGFRESEAFLRIARRSREQASLNQATIQQRTMFDARTAWRALNTARESLAATHAAVALQEEAYKGEQARYSAGLVKMSDVLAAKATFDGAQLSNLQSLLDCVVAAARVSRLDGSILPSFGFSWEALDTRAGTAPAQGEISQP